MCRRCLSSPTVTLIEISKDLKCKFSNRHNLIKTEFNKKSLLDYNMTEFHDKSYKIFLFYYLFIKKQFRYPFT